MSYAIIRNANYKRDNLPGLYKHNERKNTNYSNKDIDKNKSIKLRFRINSAICNSWSFKSNYVSSTVSTANQIGPMISNCIPCRDNPVCTTVRSYTDCNGISRMHVKMNLQIFTCTRGYSD